MMLFMIWIDLESKEYILSCHSPILHFIFFMWRYQTVNKGYWCEKRW